MQAKQRVSVLRGGQSDDLASHSQATNRFSLLRASIGWKIAQKVREIWQIPVKRRRLLPILFDLDQ